MDRNNKIKELEKELAELKKELIIYDDLSEDKKLAEIIHEKLCHWNHNDGCDWYYGDWVNKVCSSRVEYLMKAQAILSKVDYETAINVINCL